MENEGQGSGHNWLLRDKKDGDSGEEQGDCGDGELRANDIVKDGGRDRVCVDAVISVSHQPSQGNVVYWERFLHLRSIKVLLVENDDCTSHIVTALLRNCNYEVVNAANGLQAWKILEDLSNHIDLVLTEVVMPCVSGVALLYKIMSHKTRKNLPVIMMSSHDSMGLVFKCLSKGAVDFLVKPIRKNELKNLWQHVWRRCHSSSSSGSESATNTQKSVKSKSSEKFEKNCSSSDDDDYKSMSFNVGDGSDSGSGAESSWTKQDAEVNSFRAASPGKQIDECPDSTCGQVIRPNSKVSEGRRVPITRNKECQEKEENLNDLARAKDLVIKGPSNEELQRKLSIEAPVKRIDIDEKAISEIDSNTCTRKLETENLNPKEESIFTKSDTVNSSGLQTDNGEFKAPAYHPKALEMKDKIITNSRQPPVVGLRSKRKEDFNVLMHSELSAFSRYDTASNAFKAPNDNTGSGSQPDQSLDGTKKELGYSSELPQQSSNRVSNNTNLDMGSTTNNDFAYLVDVGDKSKAMSTANGFKNDLTCAPRHGVLLKVDDRSTTKAVSAPSPSHHLQQNCSHVGTEHQKLSSTHDDKSYHLLYGSSNNLASLNKSASGSNHGSNGHNGSSTADNAGELTIKTGDAEAGENRSGSGNNMDQETMFRQKRKERCFEKKGRYQSRKRLGDERPRGRGQFVRQSDYESSSG